MSAAGPFGSVAYFFTKKNKGNGKGKIFFNGLGWYFVFVFCFVGDSVVWVKGKC